MFRRTRGSLLALALLAIFGGCGDEDSFSNSLRFGTGITAAGFTLIGEASTFSLAKLGNNQLWFRLESVEDIDKRFVRLYFDDLTNKDFSNVQDYGHITLANFAVSNPGTFTVKAHYVRTVIDIGDETFIASSTLQITP